MTDTRARKTRVSIKEAFLELIGEKRLGEITMSDVAKEAAVSRSTLYSHFGNTHEVFKECVCDFVEGITPLKVHLRCEECPDTGTRRKKQPFCIALRDAGVYSALVREPSFIQAFLDVALDGENLERMAIFDQMESLNNEEKRSIICFQISGCYSAAMNTEHTHDWKRIQSRIDSFIRAGIHALRD